MSQKPVFLMSPPRHDWRLRGKSNTRSSRAEPVNSLKAREEWGALADAIVEAGGDVAVLPPDSRQNLTGMIYTAEAGEYYRSQDGSARWLLPNMAVEHRRAEAAWIGGFMEGLGIKTSEVQVTWEAQGDAIRTRDGRIVHTFGSGRCRRTEARAYGEVAHHLSDEHIQLHFHADPWFHGNTFLAVFAGPERPPRLGEDKPRSAKIVLVNPEALLPGELERLRKFLPEATIVELTHQECYAGDTNSIQVGETIIGVEGISEKSEEALRAAGLEIVKLDLGELFIKGGGAPACLTNRLWGVDPSVLPEHVLWSQHRMIEAHTDV